MGKKCDIILLSYESPGLLRKCVESVLDHTRVDSRLIIVDNGSKDKGVAGYLNSLHGNEKVSVEKIFSEDNAGFAAGMNKGLRFSQAPYVCLLNNDCVVTEGWLEELIRIAESSQEIGLVNPQSNTFGSAPDRGATINDHASLLREFSGKYVELGHAIGFACLIKREVLDKIGYLDEEYSGVCYEDTDYSLRALDAGYISVMAEGAYVYHKEQASRKDLPGKEEIYRNNRERLETRWGKLLRLLVVGDPAEADFMKKKYELLRGLTRKRSFIDIFFGRRFREKENLLVPERRKSPRHADISVKEFPGRFLGPYVVWKVLTKKKRYDAVFLKRGPLYFFLNLLSPLHKAAVFELCGGSIVKSEELGVFDLKAPSGIADKLRGA